jgi:hypothetical protein
MTISYDASLTRQGYSLDFPRSARRVGTDTVLYSSSLNSSLEPLISPLATSFLQPFTVLYTLLYTTTLFAHIRFLLLGSRSCLLFHFVPRYFCLLLIYYETRSIVVLCHLPISSRVDLDRVANNSPSSCRSHAGWLLASMLRMAPRDHTLSAAADLKTTSQP